MEYMLCLMPRLRAPQEFHHLIHKHYDSYRHSLSGVNMILQHSLTTMILQHSLHIPSCRSHAGHLGPGFLGPGPFTAGLKLLNSMAKIFSGRSWLLRIPPVFCGPVVLHRTLNSLSYAFHLIPLLSWFVLFCFNKKLQLVWRLSFLFGFVFPSPGLHEESWERFKSKSQGVPSLPLSIHLISLALFRWVLSWMKLGIMLCMTFAACGAICCRIFALSFQTSLSKSMRTSSPKGHLTMKKCLVSFGWRQICLGVCDLVFQNPVTLSDLNLACAESCYLHLAGAKSCWGIVIGLKKKPVAMFDLSLADAKSFFWQGPKNKGKINQIRELDIWPQIWLVSKKPRHLFGILGGHQSCSTFGFKSFIMICSSLGIHELWWLFLKPRQVQVLHLGVWTLIDFLVILPFLQFYLRMLDTDLGNVMRAAEPFEWHRIPFVLEASAPGHTYW